AAWRTASRNSLVKPLASRRLADDLEGTRHLILDRLRGVGGDLGGQRADFARLARKHIELAADEGRLKLDDLGEVLGAGQALGEIEAGVQIALRDVDELAVEGGGTLPRSVEGTLQRIDGLFQSFLAALIGF